MALTMKGLSKVYPNGVQALKNISLDIGNHMFGLLGPNGAVLQYFIDDTFEKITLYDNEAVQATGQAMADGKYKVTLTVQGGKAYADGNGVEFAAPLHDLIDVGVFSGKKREEKPLALRKEWITRGAPEL